MPDQIQKDFFLKHPFNKNFDLWHDLRGLFLAIHGLPRLEPLPIGCNGPSLRVKAIRGNQDLGEMEERRNLKLIRLKLLKG